MRLSNRFQRRSYLAAARPLPVAGPCKWRDVEDVEGRF